MEQEENFENEFISLLELIQRFEQAEENNSLEYFEEDAFEQIIHFYMDAHDHKKALRTIDRALQQYTSSSFFYVKKAEILAEKNKMDEALQLLETAQLYDATDPSIYLVRADIYLWQSHHEDALKTLDVALDLNPDEWMRCDLLLEKADVYEDMEQHTLMINMLKEVLKLMPDNEEALGRLWYAYVLTEQYQDSIDFHKSLIEVMPYNHLAWFNLGHAQSELNLHEEALDTLGYCIVIFEGFEPAYTCSGDINFNLERYDDALQFYLDAVRLTKPYRELFYKVGECYEMKKDYSRARIYYRKAISVDPQYHEAFFKVGECYKMDEDYGKAINSYTRAARLDSDNIDYMTALAEAYMVNEEGMKAIPIYEKILELDMRIKQHWINLATAYFNEEFFKEAFDLLGEAEERFDDSVDVLYIRFVFYYLYGNKKEAILNLERALMTHYELHTMIFDIAADLANDQEVLQVIAQYSK